MGRADGLSRGKLLVRMQAHVPCPGWGMTRRLWRGWWDCRPMGSHQLRCPKVSKGRAESPLVRPQAHTPCSRVGIDAPTTARVVGLAALWGVHTFLSMAKEKCAKESQRHGDSGKKALIAHFDGGVRYVARSIIGQISPAIWRAPNSPISAVKMGGPFSLRCLSPPLPPQLGVYILKFCRL